MKFTLKKSQKISWDGWRGWAYSSKEDFPSLSALYIELDKSHGMSMSTRSDRVYYVLDGRGEFLTHNSPPGADQPWAGNFKVEKSDIIIVPKNTPYDYRRIGKNALKMFMIHTPAFDEKDVVNQPTASSKQQSSKILKFTIKEARKFERTGRKGWIYNSKDDFENANAVYLEMECRHGKVKDLKSDRVYYIVEGKGEFQVKNVEFRVKETDVVIVPRNTPYDFENKGEGKLKVLLINCPAFERENSIKLEDNNSCTVVER
ncbi:MAG: cupin domain-containing protein [Candidatus Dojkabacteria bacterium]|nr:cupin domain-containing protein [Candidatus Dojkabacteria bacterium]